MFCNGRSSCTARSERAAARFGDRDAVLAGDERLLLPRSWTG